MGYSYSSDDGPEMCFNAPKNWQLGWYTDRQETVSDGWSGNLYGIADYGDPNVGDTVIAQIPGTTEDWYVSFNRKTGINSGTPEGGNQVLVHKRPSGLGYGESTLMAKLSIGKTYSVGTSAPPLQITVNDINLSANPAFASVTIGHISLGLKDFGWSPPASQLPLQLCEGDCDDDGDCAGGLKCFQRTGLTPVPGCSGSGKTDYDYCIYV